MSLDVEGNIIRLHGECRLEEAETLLRLLQIDGARIVDVSGVTSLHTAVFQVLVALRPPVRGDGGDAFFREWIQPLVSEMQDSTAPDAFQKGLD
jgi:anti-anti-sigma regulatory factor